MAKKKPLPKPGKPTNPKRRVGGETIPKGKSGTKFIRPKKKK